MSLKNEPAEGLPFSIKEETKLLKALDKLFSTASEPISEKEIMELNDGGNVGLMDPANVALIVIKSKRMKRVMTRFIEADNDNRFAKIPELNYEKPSGATMYSGEYLTNFMALFNSITDTNPILMSGRDYPLCMACHDFEVILAPRINNDDDGDWMVKYELHQYGHNATKEGDE